VSVRARLDETVPSSSIVAATAGLLVVASVAFTAAHGVVQPHVMLAFGAFIALGELVRVTLPNHREAAPLGMAGALAYALLDRIGADPATHGVLQVIAVTACATLAGALPHVAVGRSTRLEDLARRVLVVAFAALLFRPFLLGLLRDAQLDMSWRVSFVILVAALALVADALLAAVLRAGRDRSPFAQTLRDELRAIVGIGSAIGATGVLIALAAGIMNYWALPVFCVPLLLTQFSFRRYAAIRATYLQTIRALSRVTEVGGYTESGHARRVSQLSLAVGRELGLSEDELLELEYAALMHDIGQLSLTDPIPGGATVVAAPGEQRSIAENGAAVIRQTGVLDNVATIVERQSEPYRRPHQPVDESVPLASRIIKAVNAYDDLVGGSLESDRRYEALERLRLGMAYEYDPRVVDTLSRVIERSTRLGV